MSDCIQLFHVDDIIYSNLNSNIKNGMTTCVLIVAKALSELIESPHDSDGTNSSDGKKITEIFPLIMPAVFMFCMV